MFYFLFVYQGLREISWTFPESKKTRTKEHTKTNAKPQIQTKEHTKTDTGTKNIKTHSVRHTGPKRDKEKKNTNRNT